MQCDKPNYESDFIQRSRKNAPIVDWSTLVVEPENDGDEKRIPDEKSADEKAMFALLGLKTEDNEIYMFICQRGCYS